MCVFMYLFVKCNIHISIDMQEKVFQWFHLIHSVENIWKCSFSFKYLNLNKLKLLVRYMQCPVRFAYKQFTYHDIFRLL